LASDLFGLVVEGEAVAHGVDADGREAVLGHVAGVEQHLGEVAGVAVAVDVHVEGLFVLRRLLRDDQPELHRVGGLLVSPVT
jgi:hypothetical protein